MTLEENRSALRSLFFCFASNTPFYKSTPFSPFFFPLCVCLSFSLCFSFSLDLFFSVSLSPVFSETTQQAQMGCWEMWGETERCERRGETGTRRDETRRDDTRQEPGWQSVSLSYADKSAPESELIFPLFGRRHTTLARWAAGAAFFHLDRCLTPDCFNSESTKKLLGPEFLQAGVRFLFIV